MDFPAGARWISTLQSLLALVTVFCTVSSAQQAREDLSGLFPVSFNLATQARINTNATCGKTKPEVFCKLVDHIELTPNENLHCDICDSRSKNPEQRHPIRNAVDGSERWWQSPSLANGPEFNEVSIVLDFRQIYQIAYVIVKAANSPRPGNWILEKSLDGKTYSPWQYFAMTDQECRNLYGIEPTIGVPTFLEDDQVICTSRYSALNPLENGEIFVSIVNGRPGVFKPSPVLVEFTSAKYIRLRFLKIRTLNADLMTISGLRTKMMDSSVTRRYYYSIKDISIGGQCICYGHAAYCRRHPKEKDLLQCQCLHNTAGDNCEYCLPKFNQKPWQVGGIENIGCEECNCHGKSEECVYNATVDAKQLSLNLQGQYDGGGVCLNCKEYTTGINCERCIDGYYRRPGMTIDLPRPCMRCSCEETATSTGKCVPDSSMESQGLRAGDCICKEGFTGRSCDKCSLGYYGYPRCRPCRCKAAGNLNPETCDEPCECKDNVAGSQCDRCKPGFFNLNISNPLGCTECYCFGVSTSCDSTNWGLTKVAEVNNWVLSTLQPGGLTLLPRFFDNWLEAKAYLLKIDPVNPRSYSQNDIHYWNAPMTYLGNKLSSYGGNLVFTLKYILDSRLPNQYHLREPNVVLEGSNISLTTDKEYLREDRENVVKVPLHEDYWFHLKDGQPATREDLMQVLYNLNRLLIRATYHMAQDTVYLKNVVLDSASPLVMNGSSLPSVEQCRCPEGYAGLSCESCLPGWRRVNNQLHQGRCERCNCHRHASECDPYTGKCLDCKHSTTGDNCQSCLPGFYGDPRLGTEDDCKPCACPLIAGTNFFADRCVARPTVQNRDDYECLNCQKGYTESKCQECAPGYYGDPTIAGGLCRKCACGGNIEKGILDNCDKKTGVCNLCANNTEGEHCEKCRRGYYGSAVNGDCRPCECSLTGSTSSECNPRTGQCSCRGVNTGRSCDRCQPGYGNVTAGCKPCDCDRSGSTSVTCEAITGLCPCLSGVGGNRCDKCQNGFYGFSRSGCKACKCFGPGTKNSNDCDSTSGECICKSGVVGSKCDTCRDDYYGLLSGNGCTFCDCNGIGSKNSRCDVYSGLCDCKDGVGGKKCDQCLPGYYGFSLTGCKRCTPCTLKGHVCDPITGRCGCPPNTEGPNCEKCVRNCWGHKGDQGCKENVMGKNCDQCRPGTFSMQRQNPKGCTECYCFFRGRSCRQAPYVWSRIEIPSQEMYRVDNERTGSPIVKQYNKYLVIPDIYTFVPSGVSNQPLYWILKPNTSADMTLSYNGNLSFIHFFEGQSTPPLIPAPLVVLVGNGFIIETGSVVLDTDSPLQFNIPLHEDAWTIPGRGSPIERRLMMVVLQNLEAILVRATQDGNARSAEIGPITLQKAVPPGPNVTSTLPALGVELCDCPKRYSGESCQNPGRGFHRVLETINGTASTPENVIGNVRRCRCFGHSKVCDSETGKCQDCQHNTRGNKCELCAEGFYGVATKGKPDDCTPCTCPLAVASNNFSPTCVGGRKGLMCTKCKQGYTGRTCEKCDTGYYGDPTQVGDKCKPCNCNPNGSNSTHCDQATGQCQCLSGISGLKCDECVDSSAGVVNGSCVSCYDGCTGILLDDLANMTFPVVVGNVSISNAMFPWDKLYKKENEANELRDKLAALETANVKGLDKYNATIDMFNELADKLLDRTDIKCSTKVKSTDPVSCKTMAETKDLLKKAKDLEKEVNTTKNDIIDMIQGLDELVERLLYNHSGVNMTKALKNAKDIWKKIEGRDFTEKDKATKMENMLAEKLSDVIGNLSSSNDNTSDVEALLNELKNRIEDLSNTTNATDTDVQKALDRITELRNLIAKLKSLKDEMSKVTQDSEEFIDEAKKILEKAEENLVVSLGNGNFVDMALDELFKRVKSYNDSMKSLNGTFNKAIDHVLDLIARAKELEDLFAKSRNISGDAVKAAKAYQSIVEAISQANKSANDALKNAQESVDIAKVSDREQEVEALMNKSRAQLKEAQELLKNASGLAAPLDEVTKNLTDVQSVHEKVKDTAEETKKKIDLLPSDVKALMKKVNDTNDDTMDAIDEALDIVKRFNTTMADKVKKLKNFDIKGLNFDIDSEIALAKDRKKDADEVISLEKDLDDKTQATLRKTSAISYDLERLKEKIRDARSRVNDMKISLQADGQCHRSYRSPLTPSSTNEIRFGFKLNDSSSDMLMLLLQQSRKDGGQEFLAAEVRDKKVRFTWNSGKGQGLVTHPEMLEPQKWYQVLAKRVGSVGHLKVWNIEESSENKASKEMATMGAGCSLMNINEDSTILLAGSSDLSPIPPGITRKNFMGCMGDVSLDTNKIGVYNFKTNVPDHCSACMEIPQIKIGSKGLYAFSGYGFAQFAVQDYNSKKTKVELEFKTFYEDSRIFFVGNPIVGDFFSIELKGGHVAVNFNMGGLSFGSGQTTNIYNNNKWTKVVFDRYKLNAVLKVDSERISMKAPGPGTGLELGGAPMFFGGLPSLYKVEKFRNLNDTDFFYGCMKILNFGTLTPNADKSTLVNVEARPSCRENGIHNVGFHGDGYLILQDSRIKFSEMKNDISLSFVTTQTDGVLLIARDPAGQNYYSISLVEGGLEARMKSDASSPVIIKSTEKFNDGKMHCVSLIKDGRTTELLVNDKSLGSGESRDIAGLEDLYLGGSPIDAGDITPTNKKLDGCISDVIANGVLLLMSDAKQYKRADVGRCSFTDNYPPAQLADTSSQQTTTTEAPTTSDTTEAITTPEPTCAPEGSLDPEANAKSLANEGSMYAEIASLKRGDLAKNFQFSVDFRTFYPDGVFGYLLNSFQDTYLGIQLKDGKVQVKYNYDFDPKQIDLSTVVNDGKWHTLSVKKVKKDLTVQVDQEPPQTKKIAAKLEIKRPIYVGGPEKPEFFRDNGIDLVTHSIRGCVRNLMIVGKNINMDDHQKVRDVRNCYKNVEQGAYFEDAWGTNADTFEVMPQFSIKLEFRTAKKDGILLTSTSTDGKSGIALELHEGKLKFSLLQDSSLTLVETTNDNEHEFCGKKWHSVNAALDTDKLTISIDNGNRETADVPNGIQQVTINRPLFIGGFPKVGVAQKSSTSQEPFNGCIRNVVFDKKAIDWYDDMINSSNIRRSACPA